MRQEVTIICKAMLSDPTIFQELPQEVQVMPRVIRAAFRSGALPFSGLTPLMKEDPANAIQAVERDPGVYLSLPEMHRKNPHIARMAFNGGACPYEHLPQSVQHDVDIAFTALEVNPQLYANFPASLRGNPKIALRAFVLGSCSFDYLPYVVQLAIGTDPANRETRSGELLELLQTAIKLVKGTPWEYKSLSSDLQHNQFIALAMLAENSSVFYYLPSDLKNDFAFIRQALSLNARIFSSLPFEMKRRFLSQLVPFQSSGSLEDMTLVLEIIQINPFANSYWFLELPSAFRSDVDFVCEVMKIINKPEEVMKFLSDEIRSDASLLQILEERNASGSVAAASADLAAEMMHE